MFTAGTATAARAGWRGARFWPGWEWCDMPVVIDQARISAPGFPHGPGWWSRFVPVWIKATVDGDGTVTLEPSGRHIGGRGQIVQANLTGP